MERRPDAINNVAVTVYDDDRPGLIVTQVDTGTGNPDGATIVLEGADGVGAVTDDYEIRLSIPPAENETVTVTFDHDGQVVLEDSTGTPVTTLTFDAANWDVVQSVTVRALDDTTPENTLTSTITHTVSSTGASIS